MSAPAKPTAAYPPRDADGRIATPADMFGGLAVATAMGLVVLLAIDGIFSALGVGAFGRISGWLGGILAVWLFVEDFRAWKGTYARVVVALVAAVLGLAAGAPLSASLGLVPLFAGIIGFAIAGTIYALVWFFGIRYAASRLGER